MRRKLNAMPAVFEGKKVLLVDDSIVRGTTMSQIVEMVRRAGAVKASVSLATVLPSAALMNADLHQLARARGHLPERRRLNALLFQE